MIQPLARLLNGLGFICGGGGPACATFRGSQAQGLATFLLICRNLINMFHQCVRVGHAFSRTIDADGPARGDAVRPVDHRAVYAELDAINCDQQATLDKKQLMCLCVGKV